MSEENVPAKQPGSGANLFQVGDWPAEGTLLGRMPEESMPGPIVVSNEFADVVVTQVRSRNGVRLDIWSPRRGSRIQLDAVALDCLSYQSPDVITQMLAEKPGG
ncbi:MAG: hypothetical protein WA890_03730 [Micromonospora sp.]